AEYAKEQAALPRRPRGRKKEASDTIVGGQSVERFTVSGNVHVQSGSRTADGEHGVMDVKAQTLVLTGTPQSPPIVRDGSETLSGDRIDLGLDTKEVRVERARGRLRPEAHKSERGAP